MKEDIKITIVGGRKQPSQRRAHLTAARIIQAASDLLEGSSYNEITTNHIAQRANVAISSLYQYFPDKQSIYLTLYQHSLFQALNELKELVHQVAQLPHEEAFPVLIERWLDIFDDQRFVLLQLPDKCPQLRISTHFPSLSTLLYNVGRDYLKDQSLPELEETYQSALFFLHKMNFGAIRNYILYDYKDIQREVFVKELAAISALYLHDRGSQ